MHLGHRVAERVSAHAGDSLTLPSVANRRLTPLFFMTSRGFAPAVVKTAPLARAERRGIPGLPPDGRAGRVIPLRAFRS